MTAGETEIASWQADSCFEKITMIFMHATGTPKITKKITDPKS